MWFQMQNTEYMIIYYRHHLSNASAIVNDAIASISSIDICPCDRPCSEERDEMENLAISRNDIYKLLQTQWDLLHDQVSTKDVVLAEKIHLFRQHHTNKRHYT